MQLSGHYGDSTYAGARRLIMNPPHTTPHPPLASKQASMAGLCASPFCSPLSPPPAASTPAAASHPFDDLSAGEAFFISLTATMFLCAIFFAAYVIIYGCEVRHRHTHQIRLGDLERALIYSHPGLFGPPPAYDDEAWGDLTLPIYVGKQASPPVYTVYDVSEIVESNETGTLLR